MENEVEASDLEEAWKEVETLKKEKMDFTSKLSDIKKAAGAREVAAKEERERLEERVKDLTRVKGDLVIENQRLMKEGGGGKGAGGGEEEGRMLKNKVEKLEAEKKTFTVKLAEVKKAVGAREVAGKAEREILEQKVKELVKEKGNLVVENGNLMAENRGLRSKLEVGGGREKNNGKEEDWALLTLPQRNEIVEKMSELKSKVSARNNALVCEKDKAVGRALKAEEEFEGTRKNLKLAMEKITEWEAWHAASQEDDGGGGELFDEGNVAGGSGVRGLLDSSSEEGSQREGKKTEEDEDRLSDVD